MGSDGLWRTAGDAVGERPQNIAVVIPTFRRPTSLEALLDSLFAGTREPDQVVVVDNDPERSCEVAPRPGHQIDVIHLGAGLNLPAARNAGWRAAPSADIVFFIDDDNVVAPDAVERLADSLREAGTGLAAPVIFCSEPADVVWCGGVERSLWTTRTTLFHRGGVTLPDVPTWPTEDGGDALAVPRSVLVTIGGFDEGNFPFGHDEADIAARIGEVGFTRFVVREAHIWHEGGMPDIWTEYVRSASVHGSERVHLNWRGRVLFHRRYSRSVLQRAIAIYVFIPIGAAVATVISAMASGSVRARVRSCVAIWLGILDGYRWKWQPRNREIDGLVGGG